jgi:hypothetical protein
MGGGVKIPTDSKRKGWDFECIATRKDSRGSGVTGIPLYLRPIFVAIFICLKLTIKFY